MVGFWYNFTNGCADYPVYIFLYSITINPTQMAEDMKKNGGFIPGVKPGRKTVEFLDTSDVENHPARFLLPGICGHTACICDDAGVSITFCPVLSAGHHF
jgi:hypothetical protein